VKVLVLVCDIHIQILHHILNSVILRLCRMYRRVRMGKVDLAIGVPNLAELFGVAKWRKDDEKEARH